MSGTPAGCPGGSLKLEPNDGKYLEIYDMLAMSRTGGAGLPFSRESIDKGYCLIYLDLNPINRTEGFVGSRVCFLVTKNKKPCKLYVSNS